MASDLTAANTPRTGVGGDQGAGWRGHWELISSFQLCRGRGRGTEGWGWLGHLGPGAGNSHPPQKGEGGALKVELGESSEVSVLQATGAGGSGVPRLVRTRVGALVAPAAPAQCSSRPRLGAALTGLRDPLGDRGAVRAADQEGEAETWRGTERWEEEPGRPRGGSRGEVEGLQRLRRGR